jgi:hypothetical protein
LQQFAPGTNQGAYTPQLILGGVIFNPEECPEEIGFRSGEQMLVIHDLPGGSRVTQAMGHKPSNLSWEGHFYSSNIAARVQQINDYKVSGQEILLSWGNEKYYVIVSQFNPGYRAGYNAYSITCTVTRDANGAFVVVGQQTIDAQVAQLQGAINQQNAQIEAADQNAQNAPYQSQLSSVFQALEQAQPLAQNAFANGTNIIALIATAISGVQTYQNGIAQSAIQYTNVLQLISLLTVLSAVVQNGETPTTFNALGGNLFTIAAQQYGDPGQAFALAQANGYICAFLPAGVAQSVNLPALAGQTGQTKGTVQV